MEIKMLKTPPFLENFFIFKKKQKNIYHHSLTDIQEKCFLKKIFPTPPREWNPPIARREG